MLLILNQLVRKTPLMEQFFERGKIIDDYIFFKNHNVKQEYNVSMSKKDTLHSCKSRIGSVNYFEH